VVAGRDSCGSHRPSEKAKIGKGARRHIPLRKKIGVGAGSSELVIR
jgi:hypothetical protein